MSIKWGLSVLDWRDHAIDDHHDHPTGVYKATVRPFANGGYTTVGHIVRDSVPGVHGRNRRDGFA
jgi:hypothetical protein